MDYDDGLDDDEPFRPALPPDDRLWRHPSELGRNPLPPPSWGQRSPRREPRMWTVALLAGIIGAVFASGLTAAAGNVRVREREVPVPAVQRVAVPTEGVRPIAAGAMDVVSVAERLRPTIVELRLEDNRSRGNGSGVLFRSDGYILTNHHVVVGNGTVTAVMADGREEPARVIGSDAETDVAVVKIAASDLPVATLGSADSLRVGETAIAIGSPLGLAGGPSVSLGVVSALGRMVETRSGPPLLDMIQTDAPIAPGSSGGALVNSAGSVIGITTAIAVSDVGAEGLGFATPIDLARSVAEQLMSSGKVTRVWLGIEGEDVDGESARELGLEGGAVVRAVRDDTPAQRAGLESGDIITKVGGREIESMASLVVTLRSRKPGDEVAITFRRDTDFRTVTVRLTARPDNP